MLSMQVQASPTTALISAQHCILEYWVLSRDSRLALCCTAAVQEPHLQKSQNMCDTDTDTDTDCLRCGQPKRQSPPVDKPFVYEPSYLPLPELFSPTASTVVSATSRCPHHSSCILTISHAVCHHPLRPLSPLASTEAASWPGLAANHVVRILLTLPGHCPRLAELAQILTATGLLGQGLS